MKTKLAEQYLHEGAFLLAEYDEDGALKYRLSNSGGLLPNQAKALIKRLNLQPNNDCLFEGMQNQTWSLPA